MAKVDSLLEIIKNNQNWIDILKAEPYCLRINQNPINENVYNLKYDMIRSQMSLDEVQVARGLVLFVKIMHIYDPERDYKKLGVERTNEVAIEAYAFDKFFNIGESNCAQLDWSNPVYGSTKLDGSIIKYRGGHWYTNNGFNANAELPGDLISQFNTFQDIINEATKNWSAGTKEKIYQLSKKYTLIFELISSQNRIVVKYDTDAELILIGVRNMNTLKEEYIEDFVEENELREIRLPDIFAFSSLEEAQDFVNNLPANNEGIVLCDKHFNRAKLKTNWYVNCHRLKDDSGQLSYKHLYESIKDETIDDIISVFPEHKQIIDELLDKYRTLCEHIDSIIKLGKIRIACAEESAGTDIKEQKKWYALLAKDHPVPSILFDVWKYQDDTSKIKANFLEKLDYDKFIEVSNRFEGRVYE